MTNNLPSKEILTIAVNALKKMFETEDKWQNTFDEMFDGRMVPTYYNEPMDAIVKMIELTFNDIPDKTFGSHFSWWCYETDFGTNELADSVSDSVTKEHIPMKTIDDLYDYYVKYTLNK